MHTGDAQAQYERAVRDHQSCQQQLIEADAKARACRAKLDESEKAMAQALNRLNAAIRGEK